MKLYFENSDGDKRVIANVDDEDSAINEIKKFCKERNFEIFYMRSWDKDNIKKYDVGSHTEFFELEME